MDARMVNVNLKLRYLPQILPFKAIIECVNNIFDFSLRHINGILRKVKASLSRSTSSVYVVSAFN